MREDPLGTIKCEGLINGAKKEKDLTSDNTGCLVTRRGKNQINDYINKFVGMAYETILIMNMAFSSVDEYTTFK